MSLIPTVLYTSFVYSIESIGNNWLHHSLSLYFTKSVINISKRFVWKNNSGLTPRASVSDKRQSCAKNAGFPGMLTVKVARYGMVSISRMFISIWNRPTTWKKDRMESLGNNRLKLFCSAYHEELRDLSSKTRILSRKHRLVCHVRGFFNTIGLLI